jgi:hypothetical protein
MTLRRARTIAVALLALLLALLIGSCLLGLLAIRQGLLAPPPFALRLGDMELAGPCPPRMGAQCGQGLPYYAIWRGQPEDDGSTTYHLIYFTHLRRPARD